MMKSNLFLPIVLLHLLFGSVWAQETPQIRYKIAKGSKLLNGNAGLNFSARTGEGQGQDGVNWLTLSVTESSGFFVADNLVIGPAFSYSFNMQRDVVFSGGNPIVHKFYTHGINPGVFLRYYHMFSQKFGIFGQFNFAVGPQIKTHSIAGQQVGSPVRSLLFQTEISPNLVYFFTTRLAMTAGFGGVGFGFSKSNGVTNFSGGLRFNPALNFGLNVLFGKGVQPKN